MAKLPVKAARVSKLTEAVKSARVSSQERQKRQEDPVRHDSHGKSGETLTRQAGT